MPPRSSQEAPKSSPRDLQVPHPLAEHFSSQLRTLCDAPRASQHAPSEAPRGPKEPQDGPKTTLRSPQRPQEAPKKLPRAPQELPKRPPKFRTRRQSAFRRTSARCATPRAPRKVPCFSYLRTLCDIGRRAKKWFSSYLRTLSDAPRTQDAHLSFPWPSLLRPSLWAPARGH